MDEMQMQPEEQGAGADEVIIELLTELVQQGRSARAESVMAPPAPEAPPPGEGQDAEMAELEAMLAEAPPPADVGAPAGAMPPPKKKKPEDEDELE